MGRPPKFKDEYQQITLVLCRLGAIDVDVAEAFDVDERTIYNWKKKFPEFFQSMKEGKDEINEKVEKTLLDLAMGGIELKESKIERGPNKTDRNGKTIVGNIEKVHQIKKTLAPNHASCALWLQNRDPKRWRDHQTLTVIDPIKEMSDEELEKAIEESEEA